MKTLVALLLAAVVLVGLVALAVGVRLGRRVRLTPGVRAVLVPALVVGFAFVCFSIFGAGFWHFGGRRHGSDDGDPNLCSAAWTEFSSRHGGPDDIAGARFCRNQAVDAVAPVAGASVGVGVVAGGGFLLVLARRRRRFDTALRAVVAGN